MIYKTLTINPMHIRRSTMEVLNTDVEFNKFECLMVARYGKSGYMIRINAADFKTYNRFHQDMPYDLQSAVFLAIDSGCDFLCITETEKEPLKHLPYYQYDVRPNDYSDHVEFEDCYCCGKLITSMELQKEGVRQTVNMNDDVDLTSFFGKRTL